MATRRGADRAGRLGGPKPRERFGVPLGQNFVRPDEFHRVEADLVEIGVSVHVNRGNEEGATA